MTRKQRRGRRVITPVAPRGLRPMLTAATRRTLEIYHVANLDAIARGEATHELLWEWAGGVLTWSRVADVLGVGMQEMREQLDLATAVLDRYRDTGRIGFSGPQYQLAKTGTIVMDQLAALVDEPAAEAAAAWSQHQVDRLSVSPAAVDLARVGATR